MTRRPVSAEIERAEGGRRAFGSRPLGRQGSVGIPASVAPHSYALGEHGELSLPRESHRARLVFCSERPVAPRSILMCIITSLWSVERRIGCLRSGDGLLQCSDGLLKPGASLPSLSTDTIDFDEIHFFVFRKIVFFQDTSHSNKSAANTSCSTNAHCRRNVVFIGAWGASLSDHFQEGDDFLQLHQLFSIFGRLAIEGRSARTTSLLGASGQSSQLKSFLRVLADDRDTIDDNFERHVIDGTRSTDGAKPCFGIFFEIGEL